MKICQFKSQKRWLVLVVFAAFLLNFIFGAIFPLVELSALSPSIWLSAAIIATIIEVGINYFCKNKSTVNAVQKGDN
jgi:hypothetical protein